MTSLSHICWVVATRSLHFSKLLLCCLDLPHIGSQFGHFVALYIRLYFSKPLFPWVCFTCVCLQGSLARELVHTQMYQISFPQPSPQWDLPQFSLSEVLFPRASGQKGGCVFPFHLTHALVQLSEPGAALRAKQREERERTKVTSIPLHSSDRKSPLPVSLAREMGYFSGFQALTMPSCSAGL